ncbi:hypothetical protein Q7C36_014519 [Tachysurus vachellii]|uniref:Uncharacterized protein n=1 Tax=Tachysurus vachellii TaxID=175792 RepID=A0AA88MF42_TACVA|nr:hypothetical protein Q7C36_014519 [Tachysurus vachellii]
MDMLKWKLNKQLLLLASNQTWRIHTKTSQHEKLCKLCVRRWTGVGAAAENFGGDATQAGGSAVALGRRHVLGNFEEEWFVTVRDVQPSARIVWIIMRSGTKRVVVHGSIAQIAYDCRSQVQEQDWVLLRAQLK